VFDKLNTGTGISYSSDISYNVIIFSADVTNDTIVQFDVALSIKPCSGLKIYKPYNKTGIYAEYLKEYINGTSGPFTGADINSEKCSFSLYIKDNGRGDEDNINGKITYQMIVSYNKSTTTTTTPPALKEFKRYSSFDLTTTMDFTIVHYLGKTAPFGWQLCDGNTLLDINGNAIFNKENTAINTPDLRGKMVLGVNIGTTYTKTQIGQSGGEERHLLTESEMPKHDHIVSRNALMYDNRNNDGWMFNGGHYGYNGPLKNTGYTGGSRSHNNMPPIFVLNYIIKQPQNGGVSNKISYPGQTPNTLFKT
jgi:microcystin-dependent protein